MHGQIQESTPIHSRDGAHCMTETHQKLQAGSTGTLDASLLGLDWLLFVRRGFPGGPDELTLSDSAELTACSLAALDAYATAILACHLRLKDPGELTFQCTLAQNKVDSKLKFVFVTNTEFGDIPPRTAMIDLLSSFPQLLKVKRMAANASYLPGAGCPMEIPYPGSTPGGLCALLRDRPDTQWPQVTLKLRPNEDLVRRARGLVDFIWESGAFRG